MFNRCLIQISISKSRLGIRYSLVKTKPCTSYRVVYAAFFRGAWTCKRHADTLTRRVLAYYCRRFSEGLTETRPHSERYVLCHIAQHRLPPRHPTRLVVGLAARAASHWSYMRLLATRSIAAEPRGLRSPYCNTGHRSAYTKRVSLDSQKTTEMRLDAPNTET